MRISSESRVDWSLALTHWMSFRMPGTVLKYRKSSLIQSSDAPGEVPVVVAVVVLVVDRFCGDLDDSLPALCPGGPEWLWSVIIFSSVEKPSLKNFAENARHNFTQGKKVRSACRTKWSLESQLPKHATATRMNWTQVNWDHDKWNQYQRVVLGV